MDCLSLKIALVVFSGGQDSTTCLHWAIKKFKSVQTVFFNYQQRHLNAELKAAQTITKKLGLKLKILSIETFQEIGGNSLLDKNKKIETLKSSLPNTFVLGRNLIFLTYAAAYAHTQDIQNLVTGVCETDYSGYPDCRQDTIKSLEKTLCLGIAGGIQIHTPLMFLNKAKTILLAQKLGGLQTLADSHTCYEGKTPPCGNCPSCILRDKGFKEAGILDPLIHKVI